MFLPLQTIRDLEKKAARSVQSVGPKSTEKPPHSYIALIARAILSVPDRKLTLCDIYRHIMENHGYYDNDEKAWRNSIRYNLSVNECFMKNGKEETGKIILLCWCQTRSSNYSRICDSILQQCNLQAPNIRAHVAFALFMRFIQIYFTVFITARFMSALLPMATFFHTSSSLMKIVSHIPLLNKLSSKFAFIFVFECTEDDFH